VRPPPGYYTALNQGERAAIAAHTWEPEQLEPEDAENITYHHAMAAVEPEPMLQQALNGPDGVEWQEAVDYEISQLVKLGTWELVNTP
ncbi:hypothetical protein P692DRAFT_20672500, partial [Suillus brevipes Sb2]